MFTRLRLDASLKVIAAMYLIRSAAPKQRNQKTGEVGAGRVGVLRLIAGQDSIY
jgi:hypothetical protein